MAFFLQSLLNMKKIIISFLAFLVVFPVYAMEDIKHSKTKPTSTDLAVGNYYDFVYIFYDLADDL